MAIVLDGLNSSPKAIVLDGLTSSPKAHADKPKAYCQLLTMVAPLSAATQYDSAQIVFVQCPKPSYYVQIIRRLWMIFLCYGFDLSSTLKA
jgi:hypothetical protein